MIGFSGWRYSFHVVKVQGPQKTQSGVGPTDAVLVLAGRSGEAWATEALFRRHARMANGLAFRLLGRDSDVDDLVQESFAQAFSGLDRLKEPQAFASWLGAIVVRTAHKMIRRRRLMARLGFDRGALAIDLDALVGPQVPADDAIDLRRVYALVEKLPANVRIPLVLRRVEGLALDEIAKLVGASLATVKRRIDEGERQLRDRFENPKVQ